MSCSFKFINNLLSQLCNKIENENSNIQIQVEQVDILTEFINFITNGNQVKVLKLFLGKCFGVREIWNSYL